MRTSQSNVPIVGLRSLSAPGNKNSSRLKALQMSLSVVLNAAEPTKHGVPKVAATATHHGINPSDARRDVNSLKAIVTIRSD